MKICLSCEGVATTDVDRCAHCGVPLLPTTAVHFPHRRGEGDAANPLLGSVLDGKFLVQGVLGRGGMGTVFRACHAVSLVPLALKLLHPRLSARAEYRRSLLAEARKAGRVVHEHCARVLDVGETEEGTVYLAMELADGEPLDAWVRGSGLPPYVVVDVLAQVSRALVAIHSAGLVHRDLSSRNVMIALREGRPVVKVLDFGIAQSLQLAPAAGDASEGEGAFANPVFSAPEHLAGLDVDARADLYSLGVLGYLMLCGRLPVDSRDARAAARATVAGDLLPFQPQQSAPRRLVRLLQRCLQREPSKRPPSAQAVVAELEALAHGRLPWLPRASLVALAASVVVAVFAFARATTPFLRVVGGSLPLVEANALADSPPRYLRPDALHAVRALFGGFAARRLELEVSRANTLQWRARLEPRVEREGVLQLSVEQASWRKALDGLVRVSADGPVDVAFVVPGEALLGGARVCLDGEPPVPSLARVGESNEVPLTANSTVQIDVRERGGLAALVLHARFADGSAHALPLPLAGGAFALGAALAEVAGAGGPLGAVVLEVEALDRAGNRATSEPLTVAECDFGAPWVEVATGPAGESTIPFLEDRAVVRVRMHHDEAGLGLEVRDDQDRVRSTGGLQALTGGWYEIELQKAPSGEAFAPGLYAFAVTDAVGNREVRTLPLAFRSRRLDVVFASGADATLAVFGDELVLGPSGGIAVLTCNPNFVPVAMRLRTVGGGAVPASATGRLTALPPRWQVEVRGLPPGSYEVLLDLEERGGRRPGFVEFVQRLQVLPERVRLELPDCKKRFLPALLQANVLRLDGGLLRQGAGLRVDGGLQRYLRGRLWSGPDAQRLVPQPLLPADGADGALLPPVQLLRGRNVIALELRDVLGRPVEVALGAEPAPIATLGTVRLAVVADFVDDPAPPQAVADEWRVEFGQPVAVRLRSPLRFSADDVSAIRLVVQGIELAPVRVREVPEGSELGFNVPVAQWRSAPGLSELPRAEFARGLAATLTTRLATPGGDFALDLRLRTVRSTLRSLSFDEVAEGPVASALRSIVLVPVLVPDGGEWRDPVPVDAPARDLYRLHAGEPVRSMGDLFVQQREFTLAQYLALLERLDEGAGRRIVHDDDPLGPLRLTTKAMLPHGCDGDESRFRAAVEKAPDAAVAGIDYFQAYAAVRLLGVLAGGDPALFRLPLGCELELAAFGTAAPTARSGAMAQGQSVRADDWRPVRAPREACIGPVAGQEPMGDRVPTPAGAELFGLDFGVREWVLDLPQAIGGEGEPLLREWVADRELHVQRALELSGGRTPTVDLGSRMPPELQARLRTFAVVRGLGTGERQGLVDETGRPLDPSAIETLPPSVPGVVRTEQLRRDGRDLMPGRDDPRLSHIGFRTVGGNAFVQRIRNR